MRIRVKNEAKITSITVTHRQETNEFDLFPEMTNNGMGAINVVDENGNAVGLPAEIYNALLEWAGYDVEME